MQLTEAFVRSEGVQYPARHPRMSLPHRRDDLRQVSCLGQPEDRAPASSMECHRGRRMYNSVCLVGHVILIVEDEGGPFAQQLQAALERVGAKTMLARTPGHARDHVACFDLSAATIHFDGAVHSVEFPRLVKEMGGMPLLLYGTEPPPYKPFRNARFLAASKPRHTGAIVEAVTRLLSSSPGVRSLLDPALKARRRWASRTARAPAVSHDTLITRALTPRGNLRSKGAYPTGAKKQKPAGR